MGSIFIQKKDEVSPRCFPDRRSLLLQDLLQRRSHQEIWREKCQLQPQREDKLLQPALGELRSINQTDWASTRWPDLSGRTWSLSGWLTTGSTSPPTPTPTQFFTT